MTIRYKSALGAAALVGIVIAGCKSNSVGFNPTGSPVGAGPRCDRLQSDRVVVASGRQRSFRTVPEHDETNRSEPYKDPDAAVA